MKKALLLSCLFSALLLTACGSEKEELSSVEETTAPVNELNANHVLESVALPDDFDLNQSSPISVDDNGARDMMPDKENTMCAPIDEEDFPPFNSLLADSIDYEFNQEEADAVVEAFEAVFHGITAPDLDDFVLIFNKYTTIGMYYYGCFGEYLVDEDLVNTLVEVLSDESGEDMHDFFGYESDMTYEVTGVDVADENDIYWQCMSPGSEFMEDLWFELEFDMSDHWAIEKAYKISYIVHDGEESKERSAYFVRTTDNPDFDFDCVYNMLNDDAEFFMNESNNYHSETHDEIYVDEPIALY